MATVRERVFGLSVGIHVELHVWEEVLREEIELRNWRRI